MAYEPPIAERFLQQGGINVQTFALCIGPEIGKDYPAQALKELDQVMGILGTHQNEAVLVTRTKEALEAKRQGKIAVFLNFEGAEPIRTELGLLHMFYRNEVADGGGLSQFGMNLCSRWQRLELFL